MINTFVNFVAATVGGAPRSPQPVPFNLEEQRLCDKIIKDLVNSFCGAGRVEGLTTSNKNQKSQYAIIFRQSKSWGKMESLLNEVKSTHPQIKKWVDDWSARIAQLRKAHAEIQLCLKNLKKISAERDDLRNSRVTGLNKAQWDDFASQELPFTERIQKLLEKIKEILKAGAVSSQALNPRLFGLNQHFKNAYDYLRMNWHHLLVFSDWGEVSLDDDGKVFVAIRRLPQKLRDTLDKTMQNPLAKMVNASTKAIFIIEETKHAEFPYTIEKDGIKETVTIIRPIGIGLRRKELAPLTPDPLIKHSSNYEVNDEVIFNYPFPEGSKVAQPRSNTAMRLQEIVWRALQEANRELLAKKDGDAKISEKLKQREQSRGMFSYIIGMIVPEAIPEMLFGISDSTNQS